MIESSGKTFRLLNRPENWKVKWHVSEARKKYCSRSAMQITTIIMAECCDRRTDYLGGSQWLPLWAPLASLTNFRSTPSAISRPPKYSSLSCHLELETNHTT